MSEKPGSNTNYEPFKYATEAGINIHLGPYWLCTEENFKYIKDDPYIGYYNIYFILHRNRISVQPGSMKASKKTLEFVFNIHKEDSTLQVPCRYPNPFASKKVVFESEYPHKHVLVGDTEKKEAWKIPCSRILDDGRKQGIIRKDPSFLDFEVLYIGQTQRTTKAPAIDRLVSHKTLQRIHTEKRPDKDVYILLCCFEGTGAVEVRGTVRTQKKYEKEDSRRLKEFMKSQLQLSPEQQITLAEAALIKYFEPQYNKTHKTFPRKKKSYDFVYDMDLNAVSVEIITDLYFYSDRIKSSNKHFERFYLNDDVQRRKFLDLTVGFDTVLHKKRKQ